MAIPDVNQPVVSNTETNQPAQPGEKTDSVLLLKSLQEERDKRRLAEEEKKNLDAEIKRLQDIIASGDTSAEESKVLKGQITDLQGTVTSLTRKNEFSEIKEKYGALRGKEKEFNDYLSDPKNAGLSMEVAAKSFLFDNNLLETPRKGLEVPSGGGRNSTSVGWTYEKIEELRKSNFRQYSKLLKEGAFREVSE